MTQLESELDPQAGVNLEASDLRRLLARVDHHADKMPDPPRLNRGIALKLCELICAYRLCDVLYALENPQASENALGGFSNPRYDKHGLKGLGPTTMVRHCSRLLVMIHSPQGFYSIGP